MVLFLSDMSRMWRSSLVVLTCGYLAFGAGAAHAAEKMIAITDDQAITQSLGDPRSEQAVGDVIRMRTDRPLVIKLEQEASNILIGNDLFLNIFPDSRKTLILMPVQPGATFFRAIDADGNTIIEKRVIVGTPPQNYVRVRRACAADDELCAFQSIYYCPDACHIVYDYSNDERINVNEQARNNDDDEGGSSSDDGDNPDDLSDSSESVPQ
jgi:hypothetical protein